eukprot:scaffold18417_cov39-Phaeocystis_antarctica.AAC.4
MSEPPPRIAMTPGSRGLGIAVKEAMVWTSSASHIRRAIVSCSAASRAANPATAHSSVGGVTAGSDKQTDRQTIW